jgi:hypothetical protein
MTIEVQQVAISGGGTSTNWTLSFADETTTPAFVRNPTPAAVQTALEALGSIGVGNVAVTGSGWVWNVTFQGALADQDVTSLAGEIVSGNGTIAVSTVTEGMPPENPDVPPTDPYTLPTPCTLHELMIFVQNAIPLTSGVYHSVRVSSSDTAIWLHT